MESNKAMHKIDTAILMAAGMGTRIRPLSEETPKPLINVCGKPMIESIIDALIAADIKNICVVVGYKKEKYFYLQEKYGCITFFENTEYKTKNTISSFYAAKEAMGKDNCVVCETDLCVLDPSIFVGAVDKSRYLIRKVPDQNYEWGFLFSGEDRISKVVRPNPEVMLDHCLYGVSFWLKDDINMVKAAVEEAYKEPGHEKLAFDEVVNNIYDKLDVGTLEVKEGQIYEIDCIEDLAKVDPSYESYLER